MITIPAPSLERDREEWPDADFDLPDGEPLHASDAEFYKDDDDIDWDDEMGFGKTGGAKAQPAAGNLNTRMQVRKGPSQMITIRPGDLPSSHPTNDNDDDEGAETIKLSTMPSFPSNKPRSSQLLDEDMEADFALPSDLTQLSLRPMSEHHHLTSKGSLEWGDKEMNSSSQSSDTYSSFGFADASPSSNSTSASLPDSETDEDEEDDGDLEGLVIPSGLFESGKGGKQLNEILEKKKTRPLSDDHIKIASPNPDDDFEMGLVLDDEVDFSRSRLLQNTSQHHSRRSTEDRIKANTSRSSSSTRPASRIQAEKAAKPTPLPPVSSARQLSKFNNRPQPTRANTYAAAAASAIGPSSSALADSKPGSLRVQKSQPGMKAPSPPPIQRKLSRKASLPSLSGAGGSGQSQGSGSAKRSYASVSRYHQPSVSSRGKGHSQVSSSPGRMHIVEFTVPPTRPSTPSSNPTALRLTVPTSSARAKPRLPVSSVFPPSPSPSPITKKLHSPPRAVSPLPPRPHSAASGRSRFSPQPSPPISQPTPPTPPPEPASSSFSQQQQNKNAAKVLKRPKRQKMYGDGTELDGFADLPTDREKEVKYRVEPKGYGNRIRGGSLLKESTSSRRKGAEVSNETSDQSQASGSTIGPSRTGRLELSPMAETAPKRKKATSASPTARRKPTLIRNLGGVGSAKVVGEMRWNPQTLRWEGNDHVLREFDAVVGTSTRPALITHLTGSSGGSPGGSFASGARKVGNMIFDPQKMCWISTLPPEEEEPDVFADLADDEDDNESWDSKGGTIRASGVLQMTTITPSSSATPTQSSRTGTPASHGSRSQSRTRTRSQSGSDSDRGSRASLCVGNVDDAFIESCRVAEERHRAEMKGWRLPSPSNDSEPDRSYLFEIRALATRQYT